MNGKAKLLLYKMYARKQMTSQDKRNVKVDMISTEYIQIMNVGHKNMSVIYQIILLFAQDNMASVNKVQEVCFIL